MTAPFQSEKQPLSLTRRLRRHWPIATAMGASLALHGALLLIQQPTQPNGKTQVINARLTSDKAQRSDSQDQLPQETATPQAAQQQTDNAQPKAETKQAKPEQPEPSVVTTKAAAKHKTAKSEVDRTEKQPEKKITEPTKPTTSSVQAIASAAFATKASQQSQQSTQQDQLKSGEEQRTSDPVQRRYQDQVLAHIRNTFNLPAYTQGKIRLQLTFNYGNFVTNVEVVTSSGDQKTDNIVKKAILSANPFPTMPKEIQQPYIFRPTIDLDSPQ